MPNWEGEKRGGRISKTRCYAMAFLFATILVENVLLVSILQRPAPNFLATELSRWLLSRQVISLPSSKHLDPIPFLGEDRSRLALGEIQRVLMGHYQLGFHRRREETRS